MDTSSPIHRLNEAIAQHFLSEKKSGLALVILSVLALSVVVLILSFHLGKFELGVVFPTATIAFLQFFFGAKLYYQSKRQSQFLKKEMTGSPKKAISAEQARVEKAMGKLDKSKQILMLLFVLGFAFVIGGAFCNMGDFTLGTGIGLTVQSALTMVCELLTAYRTGFYLHELRVFIKNFSQ